MFILKNLIICALIVLTFNSCSKGGGGCEYDPCLLKATASEVIALQNYLTANNIVAEQHCSGMYYKIESQGGGAAPTVCSTVDVTYEGRLTNGNAFETRTAPLSYPVGNFIRGWINGLPLVRSGGTISLYIPPSLGYGSSPVGNIPANSILIFKINLLGVH